MYKNVFVNQCGYLPGMQKKVTIRSEKPTPFSVHKSSGEFVLSGTADKRVENASAGETDYIGDFSSLTEPGRYYIMTENRSESDTFVISENAYDHVLQKSFAFFYLQRCGCDLPKEAAGAYAHRACHTGSALVYGTEEHREVSGGWHDAGDYGRYVGPGAMAVAQLLYAYERNPSLCGSYLSPASNAACPLPAWLEELKYELDWMKKMQREDGALYHKASCRSFCGFIMPEEEQEEIVISPVSVTATGDFAAVLAMAVRFYEKYLPAYAAELADAAKKAYQAMKVMELPASKIRPKSAPENMATPVTETSGTGLPPSCTRPSVTRNTGRISRNSPPKKSTAATAGQIWAPTEIWPTSPRNVLWTKPCNPPFKKKCSPMPTPSFRWCPRTVTASL